MSFFPLWELTALPKPLSWMNGHLEAGDIEREKKEARGRKKR